MNRRFDEAIMRLFDRATADIVFSKEQIAEIERALSDDEPYATEEEVRGVIDRLTK